MASLSHIIIGLQDLETMLITSMLNTFKKCCTRNIGAFQQRPLMCVQHHWKLWLQHRKASQFSVGRMNTNSSDTLASQASVWAARVGHKFQVDLCKLGVSADRCWDWSVVPCGHWHQKKIWPWGARKTSATPCILCSNKNGVVAEA